ncbi:MAG: universal stress protein [Deltaproteobacteria bacterium]|nr:universal stress protein [Deltaproteobacteria bacterium]
MAIWKRICCPTDFTESSGAALRQAAAISRETGAELLLLHVSPPPRSGGAGSMLAPPTWPARQEADRGAELRAWQADAERLAPGAVVTASELTGPAAEEIARFVSDFACDLVVMGTHGRGAIGAAVLGSVARGVVERVRCPVLVVPPGPASVPAREV